MGGENVSLVRHANSHSSAFPRRLATVHYVVHWRDTAHDDTHHARQIVGAVAFDHSSRSLTVHPCQPNQVLSAADTSRQDLVADHAVPELLAGLAQASATRSDLTLERVAHAL